jgi:predicted phage tail protein
MKAYNDALENHKNAIQIMEATLEGLKRSMAMETRPPRNDQERNALRISKGNLTKAVIYKQREIEAEKECFAAYWR